jgi:hypothetical protein
MAAAPNLPPREPLEEKPGESVTASRKQFPWPLIVGIILVICFGLLAMYYFRQREAMEKCSCAITCRQKAAIIDGETPNAT